MRNDIERYGFMLLQQGRDDKEIAAVSVRIKNNLNQAILEIYTDMKVPPMVLNDLGGGSTA